MKKSFYWLIKTISHLEIAILASLGVMISVEVVNARPSCYLIDASGKIINLGFVCQTDTTPKTDSKAETKTGEETASPEEGDKPTEKTDGTVNSEGEEKTGENTPTETSEEKPKEVTEEKSEDTEEAEVKEKEKEELDPALFSPAQRRIPILEGQRKETLPEE